MAVSRDGGRSFAHLWDAHGAEGPDSTVTLAISPNFGTHDLVIVAAFRGWRTPGRDIGSLPPSCSNQTVMKYWTTCRYSNQRTPYDSSDSVIALSRDGGRTWQPVSRLGTWRAALLVQTFEAASPRAPPTSQVRLLAVAGSSASGTLMSYQGSVVNGAPGDLPHADTPWRRVNLPASVTVGRWGVAAARGRVLIAGPSGGVTLARLNASGDFDGIVIADERTGPFSMQMLPNADALRGVGPLVAISPRFEKDSFILGASSFSVEASRDGGLTWREEFSSDQSTTACAHLQGCAVCRNSPNLLPLPIRSPESVTDSGALCIECDNGYVLESAGKCVPPLPPALQRVATRTLVCERPSASLLVNIVYIKVPKTGSTTVSGIMSRVAARNGLTGYRNVTWIAKEPGIWASHAHFDKLLPQLHSLTRPVVLITSVREPRMRALSAFYHFGVYDNGFNGSVEQKLQFLSVPGPVGGDTTEKDGMLHYLGLGSPGLSSPAAVFAHYDLVILQERFDESVVRLADVLHVPLTDILYTDSKVNEASHAKEEEPRPVQDYLDGPFLDKHAGDFALWMMANSSISSSFAANARLGRLLEAYRELLNHAQNRCSRTTTYHDARDSDKVALALCGTGYVGDQGCNFECYDALADRMCEGSPSPHLGTTPDASNPGSTDEPPKPLFKDSTAAPGACGNWPRLYLLGAQKAATSSVCEKLVEASRGLFNYGREVCAVSAGWTTDSAQKDHSYKQFKESHYLTRCGTPGRSNCTADGYKALFVADRQSLECTPNDLASAGAAHLLASMMPPALQPHVLLIVLLREPVARMMSWYTHRVSEAVFPINYAHAFYKQSSSPTDCVNGLGHWDASTNAWSPSFDEEATCLMYHSLGSATAFARRLFCPDRGYLDWFDAPTDCRKSATGDSSESWDGRLNDPIRTGLYADQIAEWLRYWKRSQLFVLNSDSMLENQEVQLAQLFSFAGIPLPPAATHAGQLARLRLEVKNSKATTGNVTTMSCDVLHGLKRLFDPANQRLYTDLALSQRLGLAPPEEPGFAEFRPYDSCSLPSSSPPPPVPPGQPPLPPFSWPTGMLDSWHDPAGSLSGEAAAMLLYIISGALIFTLVIAWLVLIARHLVRRCFCAAGSDPEDETARGDGVLHLHRCWEYVVICCCPSRYHRRKVLRGESDPHDPLPDGATEINKHSNKQWVYQSLLVVYTCTGIAYLRYLFLHTLPTLSGLLFVLAETWNYIGTMLLRWSCRQRVHRRVFRLDQLAPAIAECDWPKVQLFFTHFKEPVEILSSPLKCALQMEYPAGQLAISILDDGFFDYSETQASAVYQRTVLSQELEQMVGEVLSDLASGPRSKYKLRSYSIKSTCRKACAPNGSHILEFTCAGLPTVSIVGRKRGADSFMKTGNLENGIWNVLGDDREFVALLDCDCKRSAESTCAVPQRALPHRSSQTPTLPTPAQFHHNPTSCS